MGKILLVYYSRTGYTAAIARELADWGGWDVEQIQDRHSRRGGWGFLRSILDVMLGRHSAILPTSKNPADYAVVVLGAPVWMGRLSAPIRTYIAQHRRHFGSLAFFCTYGGKGAEHAAQQCATLAGRAPAATLAITDTEIDLGRYWDKLGEFQQQVIQLGGG
ncbi:MAG: flavodoxin family protein [Gammaproteobacteria bacterium]